jgi:hypothetical protein
LPEIKAMIIDSAGTSRYVEAVCCPIDTQVNGRGAFSYPIVAAGVGRNRKTVQYYQETR